MRPLHDRAGLGGARLAALQDAVNEHHTLEQVVRWALMTGRRIENVVQQDEYTQDVLVSDGELCLVYDTT